MKREDDTAGSDADADIHAATDDGQSKGEIRKSKISYWLALLLVWFIGLIVWAFYLAAITWLVIRIFGS